jgi:precorrin-6x reductase
MKQPILVFGGTREGTCLAEKLPSYGYDVTVSVATDYGALMLEGLKAEVKIGRLDINGMAALMNSKPFGWVIDATHPYAAQVTKNIQAAAQQAKLPYLRLLRPEGEHQTNETSVSTPQEAAKVLLNRPGNILLTTGSKDLEAFTLLPDYKERVWVRILASEPSLHQALELGYPPNHIVAMHGPFSKELNIALLHQFEIKTMVTKRSGRAGGYQEKADAARETGAELIIIDRPVEERGKSLEEILAQFGGDTP